MRTKGYRLQTTTWGERGEGEAEGCWGVVVGRGKEGRGGKEDRKREELGSRGKNREGTVVKGREDERGEEE